MTLPLRIVFLGTPEFACPSLKKIGETEDTIELVICQPDRRRGRGRKAAPPPVKSLALDLGIEIWQPEKIKSPEAIARLKEMAPDLIVLVAFGQLMNKALLDLPKICPLNLHPSLLPAYRGPAPINWAIINGETETGATTMIMDEGVDTGPILLSRNVPIGPEETAGELHDRLAEIGADLLVETIAGLKTGRLQARPQSLENISRGRMLTKEDGRIDWTRPARELAALVRGVDPWPGAHARFKGKNVKLFGAVSASGQGSAGQVLAIHHGRLHIAAGQGSLAVSELQLEGKKRQPADQFWHGQRLGPEDFFS